MNLRTTFRYGLIAAAALPLLTFDTARAQHEEMKKGEMKKDMQAMKPEMHRVGLEGYCPVCMSFFISAAEIDAQMKRS